MRLLNQKFFPRLLLKIGGKFVLWKRAESVRNERPCHKSPCPLLSRLHASRTVHTDNVSLRKDDTMSRLDGQQNYLSRLLTHRTKEISL